MTDRQLMQQALDAMLTVTDYDALAKARIALRERLAHCDRCGKKLGGEGDIHTCTPKQKPVSIRQLAEMLLFDCRLGIDNQQALDRIAECIQQYIDKLALAQPEQEPVQTNCRHCGGPDNVICAGQCKQSTPPAAQPAPQPEQEPVAWMFQHGETGRMSFVSNDGMNNPELFLKMNPRYALVCALVTPPAAQPAMFGPMGTVGDLFDKHVIANGNLKKEWIVYLEKNK